MIENDVGHERLGADGGGVVEGLFLELVGITAEDLLLASGKAFRFFKAEHHGDVLIAVEAIGDEEGDDDGIGSVGHLGPVGDEGRLFHVGVVDFGEAAFGESLDQIHLGLDGFGGIFVQAGAVTDDEEAGFFLRDAGCDFGGALQDEGGH